jgi:hypothetical protein
VTCLPTTACKSSNAGNRLVSTAISDHITTLDEQGSMIPIVRICVLLLTLSIRRIA